MIRSICNESAVKVRSEELQIPFANLAAAIALEEFMIRLAESEYKKYLWLRNAGSLGLERYRRKLVQKLEFCYRRNPNVKEAAGLVAGQELSSDLIKAMMDELCQEDNKQSISWKWEMDTEGALSGYQIFLTAEFETIQIPLQLTIETLSNDKIQPYDLSMRLIMRNNDQLSLYQYPLENTVADCLFEIVSKLELINDMSVYQRLYTMIKKEALDGRKIQQQLVEKCQGQQLAISERHLEMIKTYRNYTYMKKKWKSYLKRECKKTPEWEEVIGAVSAFLSPIWEMMVTDMIFIGDWMPELMRFLD